MSTKRKMPHMEAKMPRCSFCRIAASEKTPLVEGNGNTYICASCVDLLYDQFKEARKTIKFKSTTSPKDIFNFLNQYVIGQDNAKKTLAVSIYNHYKRLHCHDMKNDDVEIEKSNVLLIGPTGSGKTHLARTIARRMGVPFAIGDATTLTEAGYVGEDVENLLLKLINNAGSIEEAEKGIIFIDEIDKIRKTGGNVSITRDVSGEGVQQSLLKMIEGTTCNVPPTGGRKHPEQQYLQIDTSNILFICGGSFTGLDEIIARRIGKGALGFHANQAKAEETKQQEFNEILSNVTEEDLIEFGLIPELVGRLPVIVPLNELSENEMMEIVTKPKNAIIRQYQKLAELDGYTVNFTESAIRKIVKKAVEKGTGARALRSVFEEFMRDIMFNMLDQPKGSSYLVDDAVVDGVKSIFTKEAA